MSSVRAFLAIPLPRQLQESIHCIQTDLQASNELEEEIALRRLMDAIDGRADVAINILQVDQNMAMQRQALGVTL